MNNVLGRPLTNTLTASKRNRNTARKSIWAEWEMGSQKKLIAVDPRETVDGDLDLNTTELIDESQSVSSDENDEDLAQKVAIFSNFIKRNSITDLFSADELL